MTTRSAARSRAARSSASSLVAADLRRARRPAVLRAGQPRADGAADGHRLHRRARHDDGDRRRRHRSVGRLDHRAEHRRHRAAAARGSSARCSRRSARVAAAAVCGLVNGVLITQLRSCRSSSRWARCWSCAARRRGWRTSAASRRRSTWLNDLLRRARGGGLLLPSGHLDGRSRSRSSSPACCATRASAGTCSRSDRTSAWRGCAASRSRARRSLVYTLVGGARRRRRPAAVLEAVGRRSDGRGRPGARRDRRGDHRRRQPARAAAARVVGTLIGAAIMTIIQIGCSQQGPAELGAADRHRRHHRRRGRARSRAHRRPRVTDSYA